MNLLSLKTIPKAFFDALDLLMRTNAAVYTGLAPTAHGIASLQVDVASGTYYKAGSFTSVTYGGGNVVLGAGDPTNPRYDIIYLDNTNTLRVGAGTPASQNPVAPAWPANSCPIATAFVPANAVDLLNSGANNSGFIQDLREFWPSHAATHNSGGTDALAAATATVSGLVPTPPNNTTTFLRGDATFAAVPAATATVSGLVPTPPNNTTTFLRGDATFSALPYTTPAIALGTAAAAGAANNVIRSDATILAFDATNPASLGTASPGVATVAARRDHVHPNTGLPITAVKASDQSVVNSTTLTNDNTLLFSVAANEKWVFTMYLRVSEVSTVARFKYAFTIPAAASGYDLYGWVPAPTFEAATTAGGALLTTAHTLSNMTAADNVLIIQGFYTGGANAGTVQWQFAQNTLDATNAVIVRAGSSLVAIKVG